MILLRSLKKWLSAMNNIGYYQYKPSSLKDGRDNWSNEKIRIRGINYFWTIELFIYHLNFIGIFFGYSKRNVWMVDKKKGSVICNIYICHIYES